VSASASAPAVAAAVPAAPAAPRIGEIDFVRGAFMILITWSHALVNVEPGHHRFTEVARHMLSGTVGFTTVSGMLVGWFAVIKRDRYQRVVRRYAQQAARLVVIAHPLMAIALFLPSRHAFGDFALRTLFITDTLAVFFLIVVPLIPRVAPGHRFVLGAAIVIANPLLDVLQPASTPLRLIQELFCGVDPSRPHVLLTDYGLLPLGGMFLIGSYLGDRLAAAQRAGDEARFSAGLIRQAAVLAAVSAALVGAWAVVRHLGGTEAARPLYPDYETTLYPLYLAWTMVILSRATRFDWSSTVVRWVVLIGKTSLFVYVAQYYLVQTAPDLLGWKGTLSPLGWAALCLGVVPLMIAGGAAWNRWVKHA